MLRGGVDPAAERKLTKLTAALSAANTFDAVAKEYIEQKLVKEGRAAVTIDKNKWLLDQLKPIADRPVAEGHR